MSREPITTARRPRHPRYLLDRLEPRRLLSAAAPLPPGPMTPPPPPNTTLPNLIANPAVPTGPLRVGAPGQVAIFASNPTTVPATAGVNVYLSLDATAQNADDVLVAHLDPVPIPAGAQNLPLGTADVHYPDGFAAGRYHLVTVVDPARAVTETTRADNVLVTADTVAVAPPAAAAAVRVSNVRVGAPSATAGSAITVTATATNTGDSASAAVPVTVYLSPGPMFDAVDPVLGTVTLPALAPGAGATLTATLTIPTTTPPASYFISGLPLSAADTTSTTPVPLLTVTAARVKQGGLNSGFGNSGVAANTVSGLHFSAVDTVIQGDGKLVVAGTGDAAGFVVLRFNPDGTLDPTFGNGAGYTNVGAGNARATAVTIQADAKILVAGSTTDGDFAVARFNPDGSVDASFGTAGFVVTDLAPLAGAASSDDRARDVAYRGDGRIFVVGTSDAAGTDDFAVVRFNADGALDSSFNSDGLSLIDFGGAVDTADTITIQSDGNAVVAGSASVDGNSDFAVTRFNNVGSLDPHFGNAGKLVYNSGGTNERLLAVRTQPNGDLVVGGYTASGATASGDLRANLYLARLRTDGTLDPKFGTRGEVKTPVPSVDFGAVNDLVITPEGKIVVAAKTANSLSDARSGNIGVSLTRYTASGQLDTAFNTGGFLTLFRPGAQPPAVPNSPSAPAAPDTASAGDDLASDFDAFATASVGLVSITSGGGVLTIATSSDSSDDTDTTVSVVSVVSDGPDLVSALSDSSIPDSIVSGSTAKATLTLTNSGTTTAKASVPVTVYLSTSSLHADGAGDTAVLTTTLSVNLKPGKSKKFTLRFTFPATLADGAYFVIADVNATSTVSELDTTNDDSASAAATGVAAPFVDLKVTYATQPPAGVTTGKSAAAKITLTNLGNTTATGKTTLQLLRSADLTLDDADESLLSTFSTIKLKSQKSMSLTLKFTPTFATDAPDYLAAVATFTGDTDPTNDTVFSATPTTFA